jgi:hypothetical protein
MNQYAEDDNTDCQIGALRRTEAIGSIRAGSQFFR